jgi:hypothetical protein
VEVTLGLVPAIFLLPFLLAGGLGTAMATIVAGTMDRATAVLICWVLAAILGVAALWVVVLNDGAVRCHCGARFVLGIGLLLGIASAGRWLWTLASTAHRYGTATWIVWLLPSVVHRLLPSCGSRNSGASLLQPSEVSGKRLVYYRDFTAQRRGGQRSGPKPQ